MTECYVLVQGNTVSAMGSFKGLKEVRRIIIDCMNNIHPIYRIKELMIRRELAKDPKLAGESWDRFLPSMSPFYSHPQSPILRFSLTLFPEFQKRHLKTSEKTAKKNDRLSGKEQSEFNPNSIPVNATSHPAQQDAAASAPAPAPPAKKKTYTPFPPAQQPSKLDQQLASGEYFLKPREKEMIEKRKREATQKEKTDAKRVEREEEFVAPPEKRDLSIKEKREKKRKRAEDAM